MAGRKIRNEMDARVCLAAAEASGLERAAWARREGVDGRSLNLWRMNIARRSKEVLPRPRMVELVPSEPQPARYVIRCGHLAIECDGDFEDETLLRLLQVISAC